jgi:hypothetical protein
MAKDQKPIQEWNAKAEQAAEQTMEQAKGMMENYFSWLQTTMSATPLGKTDLLEKWKGYSEKNIAATLDCVHRLSRAKDLPEVIQIQTEFMHTQMTSFTEQAKDLGETFTKAAAGSIKVPSVS